jgi:hypothetical protein
MQALSFYNLMSLNSSMSFSHYAGMCEHIPAQCSLSHILF